MIGIFFKKSLAILLSAGITFTAYSGYTASKSNRPHPYPVNGFFAFHNIRLNIPDVFERDAELGSRDLYYFESNETPCRIILSHIPEVSEEQWIQHMQEEYENVPEREYQLGNYVYPYSSFKINPDQSTTYVETREFVHAGDAYSIQCSGEEKDMVDETIYLVLRSLTLSDPI